MKPFMPQHGHGIADEVVVTERGEGLYDGTFAFSMPGTWELNLTVSAEPGDDEAAITVDVR